MSRRAWFRYRPRIDHEEEIGAMAKRMKAAIVRGFGNPLGIEEVPIATPGPGERGSDYSHTPGDLGRFLSERFRDDADRCVEAALGRTAIPEKDGRPAAAGEAKLLH